MLKSEFKRERNGSHRAPVSAQRLVRGPVLVIPL